MGETEAETRTQLEALYVAFDQLDAADKYRLMAFPAVYWPLARLSARWAVDREIARAGGHEAWVKQQLARRRVRSVSS